MLGRVGFRERWWSLPESGIWPWHVPSSTFYSERDGTNPEARSVEGRSQGRRPAGASGGGRPALPCFFCSGFWRLQRIVSLVVTFVCFPTSWAPVLHDRKKRQLAASRVDGQMDSGVVWTATAISSSITGDLTPQKAEIKDLRP